MELIEPTPYVNLSEKDVEEAIMMYVRGSAVLPEGFTPYLASAVGGGVVYLKTNDA